MPTRRRSGDRNPSQVQPFSIREFFERFPTDDACLEHLMELRYGLRHPCDRCDRCLNFATFHRLTDRPAYSCAHCGHHVYPCAGTIFQDTRTPLQMWFYAIYLFITTRHGVSGKELQRELGVTYKTAYRIGMKIRELMEQADMGGLLTGHVEIDEAYVGGHRPGKRGRGAAGKTIVMGMKERGGRMAAQVIPDVRKETLRDVVLQNVQPGAVVSTDELISYGLLGDDGFTHGAVKHGAKEWSWYDYRTGETFHTNNVEGFWKLFKNSIRSTHIHISGERMPKYLAEFCFRSNWRQFGNEMFDLLLSRI
ncbi:MAG: IS1595 family transposase [Alphaproteobacteria bacterium]|nr:IS1595 family transposase [Alphaproteobacteria bacterium]